VRGDRPDAAGLHQQPQHLPGSQPALAGVGPEQHLVHQDQRGAGVGRRALEHLLQPANLGVEERDALLQRVLHPHAGPGVQRRQGERRASRPPASASTVFSPMARRRWTSGHVRAGDQGGADPALERHVVRHCVVESGWASRSAVKRGPVSTTSGSARSGRSKVPAKARQRLDVGEAVQPSRHLAPVPPPPVVEPEEDVQVPEGEDVHHHVQLVPSLPASDAAARAGAWRRWCGGALAPGRARGARAKRTALLRRWRAWASGPPALSQLEPLEALGDAAPGDDQQRGGMRRKSQGLPGSRSVAAAATTSAHTSGTTGASGRSQRTCSRDGGDSAQAMNARAHPGVPPSRPSTARSRRNTGRAASPAPAPVAGAPRRARPAPRASRRAAARRARWPPRRGAETVTRGRTRRGRQRRDARRGARAVSHRGRARARHRSAAPRPAGGTPPRPGPVPRTGAAARREPARRSPAPRRAPAGSPRAADDGRPSGATPPRRQGTPPPGRWPPLPCAGRAPLPPPRQGRAGHGDAGPPGPCSRGGSARGEGDCHPSRAGGEPRLPPCLEQ
jgi:hypothetical protein